MTTLGENQIFDSGSFYRARYVEDGASHQILGISPDKYKASQLWASAPDQIVSPADASPIQYIRPKKRH